MTTWNPEQYLKFKSEREKPFTDLIAPYAGQKFSRILDVGCGTGNLTEKLWDVFQAESVTGVDASAEMLARATANGATKTQYVSSRFEDFRASERFDLIFSNAAIQWMPDQPAVFRHLHSLLSPGGVLLIQMPNNGQEASHRLVRECLRHEPAVKWDEGPGVRELTFYAKTLFELGFGDIDVREKIYLHPMPSARSIAEWTRGTFLLDVERQLAPEHFARFLRDYEERLTAHYGTGPCLFLFRRFLLGARRPTRT